MDSSSASPEQSGTLSSHSLQNIAKAVIPLLSVPKIDAPETQVIILVILVACRPVQYVELAYTRTANIQVLSQPSNT